MDCCASLASFRSVVAFQAPLEGILNSSGSKFEWRMSCNWVSWEGLAKAAALSDCCGGTTPTPDVVVTKFEGFRPTWSRSSRTSSWVAGIASPPRNPSEGLKLPSSGFVGGIIHSPFGTAFPANTWDLIFHLPPEGVLNSFLLTPFNSCCSSVSLNLICLSNSCFDIAGKGAASEALCKGGRIELSTGNEASGLVRISAALLTRGSK